ncbi:MAG: hypothetical protein JSR39_09470 [Verrucomicrobia bacterium]|nr:hypothetical protein [Verrucomicrobiota bacterium]
MWLDEEVSENHPLARKFQYMTLQSCERSESEIHYKNTNRKFISFDLRDRVLMALVGQTLRPFGFWQNLHDYFIGSKFHFLRVWAETQLANRGERHLRNLYLQHPSKFFEVEYEDAKNVKMKIVKCNYIISEMSSNKRIALNDNQSVNGVLDGFRQKIHEEEQRLQLGNQLFEAFAPESNVPKKTLIGHSDN